MQTNNEMDSSDDSKDLRCLLDWKRNFFKDENVKKKIGKIEYLTI